MRVTTISLVGLLLLSVITTAFAEGGIAWVYDVGEAQQIAQRDQRLLLLHFYADWCGPCRNLEQSVFPDLNLGRTLAASYVPVKINVDRNQELAKRYGVSQIPMDVITDSQGRVLHQTSSPANPAQYVQLLGGLAANGAASLPVQAVSAQAPRQSEPPAAPSQNAWDSPWLQQDRTSNTSGSYNPRLSAADNPGGVPTQQNRSSSVAPLTSQAASNAALQSTWQPNRAESAWQTNAAGTTAVSPPASSPVSSPAPLTGSDQRNPYANAPVESFAPGTSTATSPNAQQGTWGQAPNSSSYGAAEGSSGQWNPQATTPQAAPAGSNFGNPYAQPGAAPASTAPPASSTAPTASSAPPLALDGYCPVTLAEEERWIKGDPAWGALHRGRTYLFHDQQQQQRFLADPDRYSPVLSGYDPIRYVDNGQPVPGLRQHGMWFRGKIYLFADESSLDQFSRNPEHYAQRSHEIMMNAGR